MLDEVYRRLHRRRYVHPDPLEFLYAYDDPRDREIVALLAALLAYGRVAQILRSVSTVLARLSQSPAAFVRRTSDGKLRVLFADFRHRFQTGKEISALLAGVRRTLKRHGSLEACFLACSNSREETVLPALRSFVGELNSASGGACGQFLPDPAKGSACKRLHLMLRWMVRRDRVDPGGWRGIPKRRLIVPLDTHMHRIALALGATSRTSADARTAMEVTSAFGKLCPSDPVRYDFSLTRLGIHPEMDLDAFLARCTV